MVKTLEQPKIDKDIPIPVIRRNEEQWKVAEEMEVGDSVFYDKERDAKGLRNKIKSLDGKAKILAEGDGYRVWKK